MFNQSFLQSNSHLLQSFLERLQQTNDRSLFQKESQDFDQQYSEFQRDYTSTTLLRIMQKQAIKLNIPKHQSLADSMLRSTLGSDEKYAQKYLEITNLSHTKDEDEKKRRIEEAKNKFSSYNSRTDFIANTKPYMNKTKLAEQRPVIQNQYDMYIKTHLTFLDRPKPSSKNQEYSNKQTQTIARKINQIGGIEDTIGPIQHSLSTFQLRGAKTNKNQSNSKEVSRRVSPSASRGSLKQELRERQSWLDQSKRMRQQLSSKAFAL